MRKKAKKMSPIILINMAVGSVSQIGLRQGVNTPGSIIREVSQPIELGRILPGGSRIIGNEYANNSLPLQITRNSYNIVGMKLPYYLFCPDAISTNYATVAKQAGTLPDGMTMVVSIFQNRALRFTFTYLGQTDTVDVTTQFPVPYPIIQAMIQSGDWFISKGFQQTVGSNYNAQFNGVSLAYGQLSFNGFVGANAIPLSNAKSAFQYQQNIIAVNRLITINTRRFLGMEMAASAPASGDEIVVNDFDITFYHSGTDFTGPVVSSEKTDFVGGGAQ